MQVRGAVPVPVFNVSGRGAVPCARSPHGPLRPTIPADGEDAVPPNPPPGRGAVLCARLYIIPGRGTVLRAREILADRGDAVPPVPLAEHRAPLCVLCVSVVKP
jgi:hypothetical protein